MPKKDKTNLIQINTGRYASLSFDDSEIKEEILEVRKNAEYIIDMFIFAKSKIELVPIKMRKLTLYTKKILSKIKLIPLVLRKRVMYERIVNG